MKFKIKYIMLLLALSVAGCAAYFSVWGLSQLFAGASTAVIIMASVLEIGKIVTTTALHTYWDKLAKGLRAYLTLSVAVLMFITSAGIYGFLSNAYQKTANKLEIHEGELGVLNGKKQTFEKKVTDNQKIIDSKNKRIDQLSGLRTSQEARLDGSKSNKAMSSVRGDISSANSEIQKLSTDIEVINTKNEVLSDSINDYNTKVLNLKSGKIGRAHV
jgi:peptidoglycan hydrolase CwlO-like protein